MSYYEDYLPTLMYDPDTGCCTFTAELPDDARIPVSYCGAPVAYWLTEKNNNHGMIFGACAAHTAWMRANRGGIIESVRPAA